MSLTNFCCCCDLRRGCVVFAWFQMMILILSLTTSIGCSDFYKLIATSYNEGNTYNPLFQLAASISLATNIINGYLIIKIATCVSLLWGVVKKCHLYYQPWLFINGIDVCISSLTVLVLFILSCTLSAFFLIFLFICGGITALNWYFWICVYTVYKKDMKPSILSFEMGCDNYTDSTSAL